MNEERASDLPSKVTGSGKENDSMLLKRKFDLLRRLVKNAGLILVNEDENLIEGLLARHGKYHGELRRIDAALRFRKTVPENANATRAMKRLLVLQSKIVIVLEHKKKRIQAELRQTRLAVRAKNYLKQGTYS